MTAEEYIIEKILNEKYGEVLIKYIAKKAAKYAYADLKENTNLGSGNQIDILIKATVKQTIKRLDENTGRTPPTPYC